MDSRTGSRKSEFISENLRALINRTGCELVQSNGQRRYGPPPNWVGPPPSKGCEIFFGKLPRDCYEDELVPAFSRIGPIYEMRLMMDFNGSNRGYGFVKYCNPEHARRAVMLMDEYEIRPGKSIGVSKSVDNCRLFCGHIDVNMTADEVMEELSKAVAGLRKVIMYPSVGDASKNRGFVFLEFETHRLAAMARRELKSGDIQLGQDRIVVDWAEPEPETDPKIMAKIRKLYVRNLSPQTTEDFLYQKIAAITSPANILKIKKLNDYAFIHFRTRAAAELVLLRLQNAVIHGRNIEVTWARPPMYSKSRIALPDKMTLCLSLPPRLRCMNRQQNRNGAPVSQMVPAVSTFCYYRQPESLDCAYFSQHSGRSSYNASPPSIQTYDFNSPVLSLSPANLSPTVYSNLHHQMQNMVLSSSPSSDQTFWSMPFGSGMSPNLPSPVPVYYPYVSQI